jgi:3-mercaptopyruvate sulfurtransferase SseA
VALSLIAEGLDPTRVRLLQGGLRAWIEAGLPIEGAE